ncbi:MAG: hypothetical protein HOC20_11060 [Chloroflexi bacterium]|jgi:hypothetical protein|nr:hypothetical protein [Chloroflexota bacterium]
MGLKDKIKKGSGDKGADDIGGIVPDKAEASKTVTGSAADGNAQGSAPPAAPAPAPPPPPKEEEKKADSGGALSGLDIFSQETGSDDEGNKLADQLPEVDIHGLLRECKEIAAELAAGSE